MQPASRVFETPALGKEGDSVSLLSYKITTVKMLLIKYLQAHFYVIVKIDPHCVN
jgi:hypothetical protein